MTLLSCCLNNIFKYQKNWNALILIYWSIWLEKWIALIRKPMAAKQQQNTYNTTKHNLLSL